MSFSGGGGGITAGSSYCIILRVGAVISNFFAFSRVTSPIVSLGRFPRDGKYAKIRLSSRRCLTLLSNFKLCLAFNIFRRGGNYLVLTFSD
jgi:hypothetical protein